MIVTPTALPEVLIIEPKVFGDERGFFFESFNQRIFEEAVGHPVSFVQDNHSESKRGVLRGLHFQMPPHAQGKLVRVVQGEVFDVAVDIRPSSSRFGQWVGMNMSAESKQQLWIPAGFAHGFLTLSETAHLLYKATNYYAPSSERSISWRDPQIAIDWPYCKQISLSKKDEQACCMNELIDLQIKALSSS
jgi:dTDP-4-dehydrorhamnose 3,5-epimerase